MAKFLEIATSIIGGFFGYFLGGVDGMLFALLTVMAVDYVSGVLVGVAQKNISSEIGFKGLAKKALIIGLIGVSNLVDVYVMEQGSAIKTATLTFFFINECISILENAGNLGVPLPAKLKGVLQQIKSKEGDENEDKGN